MERSSQEGLSSERIRNLLAKAKGKQILVLGAGVTGRAVCELLSGAAFGVTVIDQKKLDQVLAQALETGGVRIWDQFSPDENSLALVKHEKFVFSVLSPGISLSSSLVRLVTQAGIPCVSELDLAIPFIGMPTIAVTGTNGKTTTVTLIEQMLINSGINAQAVGNIGRPFVSLIDPSELIESECGHKKQIVAPMMVAEVSSYQLETAVDFTPQIGVWLNIEDDHLERHGSLDEYLRMKARIFAGQNKEEHWSLVYADDPHVQQMNRFARGRLFPFGSSTEERVRSGIGCYFREKQATFLANGKCEEYALNKSRLLGEHNRVNLCASIASARLAGGTCKGIQETIDTFVPLDHRLEFVAERGGVQFINDSKATNVSATCAALKTVREEFKGSGIVLLLGGQAKEGDWQPVFDALLPSVKGVVVFGGSRDEIFGRLMSHLENVSPRVRESIMVEKVNTLGEAIQASFRQSAPGDVVLFAPACSSFDQFQNYEERGNFFREAVKELVDRR